MSLGFVVAGAILVEYVFNYPGVGWMFLRSVETQDYALMQGLFLLIVVAVLTSILAAAVLTAFLDPRPRDVRGPRPRWELAPSWRPRRPGRRPWLRRYGTAV